MDRGVLACGARRTDRSGQTTGGCSGASIGVTRDVPVRPGSRIPSLGSRWLDVAGDLGLRLSAILLTEPVRVTADEALAGFLAADGIRWTPSDIPIRLAAIGGKPTRIGGVLSP
jgi:hypothetical protein